MTFITIFKITFHNINFVKIIIVGPKNQNWYPKLNVPYFWNNYTICIIILDLEVPKRRSPNVFSPCFNYVICKIQLVQPNYLLKKFKLANIFFSNVHFVVYPRPLEQSMVVWQENIMKYGIWPIGWKETRLPLVTQPFAWMCSCMQGPLFGHMFFLWEDNYLGLFVFQLASRYNKGLH
jgi:hypothetical protein